MLQTWLAVLESWAPVAALRQSTWGYPIVSGSHVLSLALMFGSIVVVDLRLAGRLRGLDRTALVDALVPIALYAFVVAAISGLMLFAPAGREYLGNPYFIAKLLLIVLAGINALALHVTLRSGSAKSLLRVFGLSSLLLWCSVIFAGRMLAFG